MGQASRTRPGGGPALVREARRWGLVRRGVARPVGVRGSRRERLAHAHHGAHQPWAEPDDRGVIGHAWSPDLEHWELREPLTKPGQGFGQLEVFQTAHIDGRSALVFNCLARDVSRARRSTGTRGGVWLVSTDSALGPYPIANAQQITDHRLYVGKFINDRETGETKFLAFINDDGNGNFVGEITNPLLASWDGPTLMLTTAGGTRWPAPTSPTASEQPTQSRGVGHD